MKPQGLWNLLSIGILAAAIIGFFYHRQQASQAARPDYDDPAAPQASSQPSGVLPQSELGQVQRVSDGDTLVLQSGEKIRLCGIDAPEIQHGQQPGQPLGEQSKEKLRSLLATAGNQVILMPIEKDRYGRMVAEVFVKAPTAQQPEQELFINGEMVASGMAYHYQRYSNRCPNGDAIDRAEGLAKQQQLGVWREPNAVKPWDYRKLHSLRQEN